MIRDNVISAESLVLETVSAAGFSQIWLWQVTKIPI